MIQSLAVLLGLLLVLAIWGRPLARLMLQRLPHSSVDGEQLLLWGGLLLSALSLAFLVLYLLVQP